MSNKKLKPYRIKVTWFKPSGKYYSEGFAIVNSYYFQDSFKQELVNTQTGLIDGWNEQNYFTVLTDNMDENDPFALHLWSPQEFSKLKKQNEISN